MASASVPASTRAVPVKVFVPESVSVPTPCLRSEPEPEITPARVWLAAVSKASVPPPISVGPV